MRVPGIPPARKAPAPPPPPPPSASAFHSRSFPWTQSQSAAFLTSPSLEIHKTCMLKNVEEGRSACPTIRPPGLGLAAHTVSWRGGGVRGEEDPSGKDRGSLRKADSASPRPGARTPASPWASGAGCPADHRLAAPTIGSGGNPLRAWPRQRPAAAWLRPAGVHRKGAGDPAAPRKAAECACRPSP